MSADLHAIVADLFDNHYYEVDSAAHALVRTHAQTIISGISSLQRNNTLICNSHTLCSALNWLEKAASQPAIKSTLALSEGDISRRLIEHAAHHWIDFLSGRMTGQEILLRGGGLDLWERYFSSDNYLYAVFNRMASQVACKLSKSERLRVLELGAGSGGATCQLVDDLENAGVSSASLTVSDVSVSLLWRTRSRIAGRARNYSIEFKRLDFDQPLIAQGLSGRSFDMIIAVNALHNSRNIIETLTNIKPLLSNVGIVVVVESLSARDRIRHQEFIFNLLPLPTSSSYPGPNQSSRFFSEREWISIFQAIPLNFAYVTDRGQLALLACLTL